MKGFPSLRWLLLVTLIVAPFSSPLTAGEPVWLDLDQPALDAAYNQAVYAPNLEQVLARYATNSDAVRQHIGEPQTHAYGTGADESLDVYPTAAPNAPILIFIHGGAWKLGVARDNAHAAEMFVRAGIHFVVPDFSPVQTFHGDLRPMAAQLRRAVTWIHQNASTAFGGNPQKIYLAGFSSGGHLAAVLLTTDWTQIDDQPVDLIKGAILCSGMYDLTPVSLSSRRDYVTFSPSTISALSPIRHLEHVHCPVVVAHGTAESPEFQRQAREFTSALLAAGKSAELLVAPGYNHFEVIETLANPYRLLGRAALAQIQP